MKLNELVDSLKAHVKAGYGDLDVVYSYDDEGNGFSEIEFPPTLGEYDQEGNEFYPDRTVSAICIN